MWEIFSWRWYGLWAAAALALEAALGAAVVLRVPYTEIDWRAYMDEVGGFLQGERDYVKLRGDTGPLVYPAGFVYIYSALRQLTSEGADVRAAQWCFLALYLVCLALALWLYGVVRPGRSPWVVLLLLVSKRIHSIFMLRMFNDGVATTLLLGAVLLFLRHRWSLGCLLYSLAVSVKMNILLFAPGLLLLLLRNTGPLQTVVHLAQCAAVQLLLGAPFLLTFPVSYITKSFELGRVFTHKWTMNWKFLPEDVFVDARWAALLLLLHLGTLALLFHRWFLSQPWGALGPIASSKKSPPSPSPSPSTVRDSPRTIALVLFVCNFVGVAFARTLHPQFYVWYFHSIPLLLAALAPGPSPVETLVAFAAVEYAFSYGQPRDRDDPATPFSSALLQLGHLLILARILLAPPALVFQTEDQKEEKGEKGVEEEKEDEDSSNAATAATTTTASTGRRRNPRLRGADDK